MNKLENRITTNMIIENNINKCIFPNKCRQPKNILFTDTNNNLKTIVNKKFDMYNINMLDFIISKLYDFFICHTFPEDRNSFLPNEDIIPSILERYNIPHNYEVSNDTEHYLEELHKAFTFELDAKYDVSHDENFHKMFERNNRKYHPIDAANLIEDTSNTLFNTYTNIIVKDPTMKSSRKLVSISNFYKTKDNNIPIISEYNNTQKLSSKLFNIKVNRNSKSNVISSFTINFDTFLGSTILINTINKEFHTVLLDFYKLSEYAQYVYKFIILLGRLSPLKKGNTLFPRGITFDYIKNRINIHNDDIVVDSLNELQTYNWISKWNDVPNIQNKRKIRIIK
jgi:hypothetical protein